MPPEERDRTDATEPLPIVGEWGNSDSAPDAIPTVYPEPELEPVFCRRCGETSKPVGNCCPWCGLWLVGPRPQAKPVDPAEEDTEPEDDWHTAVARPRHVVPVAAPAPFPPLVVVFVSYGLLILSLIGFAVLAFVYGVSSTEEMYTVQAVVELADAALVVIGLALTWQAAKQRVPEGAMGWTWLAAFPVLAVLLCLGIAYTTFLRELLKPFINGAQLEIQVTWVTVLIICVQPAIFEELFFRQMTLGVFRRSMNLHLAVWLTAAMFAVAHLGNPLGMPYLFLVGGALGYARVYGGLTLPMLMHFVHNFVVIAYEAWK